MRKMKLHATRGNSTDAENYLLSGPVKQVMETRYKAHLKDGAVVQGKMECDSSSSETNYITTYNKKGGRLFEQTFGPEDYHTSTFDDAGRKVKDVWVFKGKLYSTTTTIYNEKGWHVETVSTDANGDISWRSTNVHNDTGQALEACTFHGKEEKLYRKTIYTYEDTIRTLNGINYRNMLTSIEYDGQGNIELTSIRKYNEQGKIIENMYRHTDEKKRKFDQHHTSKYNEQGDCIEMNYYNPDGSLKNTNTFTYEYDSEGKKIIEPREPYDPYALKPGETEEFENDHHGNWIKKTTFYQKKPVNIMLRQITYYGEESENREPFVHPLLSEPAEKIADVSHNLPELSAEDNKWLAEGTNAAEAFPLHRYYSLMFNELPSVTNYTTAYIEAFALLKMLEEKLNARVVHSAGNTWGGYNERLNKYTLSFQSYHGYLLQASSINRYEEDEYEVPSHIDNLLEYDEHLHFSSLQLLRPGNNSGIRDTFFEEQLEECINECTLERKPEKPFINIIETNANGFAMQEHPVDDDFEIRDLNVNYGYGFEEFHNDLMQRFNKSTKGLVLFHGQPGTGKTYYIRHLLRKMVASRKVVIYMPPNMVDHLVEPGFMTFLMQEVRNWSAEGNFCVMLIEDAEPLLAKRQEGVRIQGVTNLLNLSDGLLNDMLNLQIICTFNVDLKKLDSALLRPGRLIARKEFKALSELDANLLAQRLGIKHRFKGPATLSEIYAMRKGQNTLIHDVEPDKDSSTLLDDLLGE